MPINVVVNKDSIRADKVIKERFCYLPISMIYKLFRKGKIKYNNKKVKEKQVLNKDDVLIIYEDENKLKELANKLKEERDRKEYNSNFSLVYEDNTLLVCNKPFGISVHRGKNQKRKTLLDLALIYGKKSLPPFKPMLIHRLDKDTSGVILLTKKQKYLDAIIPLFKEHKIKKVYYALCHGVFNNKSGIIKATLGKESSRSWGKKSIIKENGVKATTKYKVVKQYHNFALLEVEIITGKMHQIRVHLNHIGHPIIGDEKYGNSKKDDIFFNKRTLRRRLYLHSFSISYKDPFTQKENIFIAPLPNEFSS